MALMEALTIGVGGAVAKTALKLWLKDADYAQATGIAIVDILAKKLPDFTARRRTERDFERIAEEVAGNLAPFFEAEARDLPENEQEAAALAVADTFNDAKLGDDILFKKDLDPLGLERHLRETVADKTKLLNQAATSLYHKALRETCNYVIEITSTLPDFTLKSTQELLKREGEILTSVQEVLEDLGKIRVGGDDPDQTFETEYRRTVARKLDRLELFGITTSEASRRYSLSVAYIALTAAKPIQPESMHDESDEEDEANGAEYLRIDEALASSQKVLIRGEAGSGKTTLLQWLAVQAARNTFAGALEPWNGVVPFFVQLRRWVGETLPTPEHFPQNVAPAIAGSMPAKWVHRQLEVGALVLIDGVDEVPESQRTAARTWIDDLVQTFPQTRFVVTSRPAAVQEGWLSGEGFDDSELQPMERDDIFALIDQWHEAARQELSDGEQRAQLKDYRDSLKKSVAGSRPIFNLATSPLMCAMLCTLHLDRKKNIPHDRMELYRIALETILDRREAERETKHPIAAKFQKRQKEFLLREFAYLRWSGLFGQRLLSAKLESCGCGLRVCGQRGSVVQASPTAKRHIHSAGVAGINLGRRPVA